MTSHDHMIKGSCDFMDRSPSREVTILFIVMAIGTVVVVLLDLTRPHDERVL